MSSLAQEESRSISENVTWGQCKRFADGKVSMPYKQFLGYEKGEDGLPSIAVSEAKTIQLIYRMFMEGRTTSAIARYLTKNKILTPTGKSKWQVRTMNSILSNEKYKGDALLQKRFTVGFLTKTIKDNEGEVPQYYVENSHPAIIDPEEFDAVQEEIKRRKIMGRPAACQSPLSTKLICGDCGGFFGSKVWSSNTKYRKVIWQCNEKYKGEEKCSAPHVTENDVKRKFVEAFNSILIYREELIVNCRLVQEVLVDYMTFDEEIEKLHQEIELVAELSRRMIYENANTAIDQEKWQEQNNKYLERHQEASRRINELEELKRERQSKNLKLEQFIKSLKAKKNTLQEFDEQLWIVSLDKAVVKVDGGLVFTFKDGTEIEV